MKNIARIISVIMILSMMYVPTHAVEAMTTDEVIEYFAQKLIEMEHKNKYVELLEVVQNLDDPSAMLQAYANAFNSLSGGQQSNLAAMELIMDQMAGISTDIIDENFSIATWKDYLGISDDESNFDLLVVALKARAADFETISSELSQELIDNGLDRLNLVFDLINDVSSFGGMAALFTATEVNGLIILDDAAFNAAILLIGYKTGNNIQDSAPVKAAINELVDYYNGLTAGDKVFVFDYFLSNGLVRITDNSSTQPGGGSTPPIIEPVVEPVEETELGDEIIPEANILFADLGSVSWAWTAIRELFIADVIKGKGNGSYDPNGYITRAEFAALLTRLLETGIPEDSDELEEIFEDVNSNEWYYQEVMAAYEAGYINGVGNQQFDPSKHIDREQIATIISRVLINEGIDKLTEDELTKVLTEFADIDEVSSWAKQGTGLLAKLEIITGVEKENVKTFNFKTKATRAEVAVILYRITSIIETKVEIPEE